MSPPGRIRIRVPGSCQHTFLPAEWETPLNSEVCQNHLHQKQPHLPPVGNWRKEGTSCSCGLFLIPGPARNVTWGAARQAWYVGGWGISTAARGWPAHCNYLWAIIMELTFPNFNLSRKGGKGPIYGSVWEFSDESTIRTIYLFNLGREKSSIFCIFLQEHSVRPWLLSAEFCIHVCPESSPLLLPAPPSTKRASWRAWHSDAWQCAWTGPLHPFQAMVRDWGGSFPQGSHPEATWSGLVFPHLHCHLGFLITHLRALPALHGHSSHRHTSIFSLVFRQHQAGFIGKGMEAQRGWELTRGT